MATNAVNTKRFSGSQSSARSHHQQHHPAESPPAPQLRQADLLYFTDIEPRSVEWIWQDWLAAGSVAVLSGEPGSGKTWVTLAMAAAFSQGQRPGQFPGAIVSNRDAAAPPCTILYASTHYVGSELIRPRFLSLGGDPARLVLLRGVAASSAPGPLSLGDTSVLEDALARTGARLLIVDPMHSYLAAADRHRAHQAAPIFDNLARLAEENRCCILLVRHLRRRGQGHPAVELSAAVRTELRVGSSPDAPSMSALVPTKSNLGPLPPSLGYRIDAAAGPACAFRWTGPSPLTAEDLQRERPIGAGLPRRRLAAEWLRQQLRQGPQTQGTIEQAAHRDGACMITIRRAKQDIGVVSTKDTFTGAWSWQLPQNSESPHASEAEAGGGNSKK